MDFFNKKMIKLLCIFLNFIFFEMAKATVDQDDAVVGQSFSEKSNGKSS